MPGVKWVKICGKPPLEAKIPNAASKFSALSHQVAGQLRQLLSAAEQGEWEQVVNLAPSLSASLEAFRSFSAAAVGDATDRKQLQEIAGMLDQATALCATRKEQIGPLVRSLKEIPLPAGAP